MLAGALLVFVAAWAVAAIALLSSTLAAANSIDGSTGHIKQRLAHARGSLDMLPLADSTARIASRIATSARPLSGDLDHVNARLSAIDQHARSIVFTVALIDGHVRSIDTTAHSIRGRVESIDARAHRIHSHARAVLTDVDGTDAHSRSILASVRAITARLRDVSAAGREVDRRTAGINRRVDALVQLGGSIEHALSDVLQQVGLTRGRPADATIYGHANSIDCRVLGPRCER